MNVVTRKLEIDCGHRLLAHEGKCRNYHGHRYVFEVTVAAPDLDQCGRVIDFSVIKEVVGGWLDETWDHGMILQDGDPLVPVLEALEPKPKVSILDCPPTAENLVKIVFDEAHKLLGVLGVQVVKVRCYETPNCWSDYPVSLHG